MRAKRLIISTLLVILLLSTFACGGRRRRRSDSHVYPDTHTNANADSNAKSHTNTDAYANADTKSDTHTNAYANPDTNTYAYLRYKCRWYNFFGYDMDKRRESVCDYRHHSDTIGCNTYHRTRRDCH
jgi:hypothetical protein